VARRWHSPHIATIVTMRHDFAHCSEKLPGGIAMSEAANVSMLQEAYRRWKDTRGGSVDHWMSICDENIKFGSLAQGAPQVAYLTSYKARDELARYFEGLAKDWEMIDYRVDALVAQDDRVVMLGECSWRYKANGKVVKTPKVDSWRFAHGKAVEFYEYYDTAQVQAATA
jgi:ketosteroid isomerase-like protein